MDLSDGLYVYNIPEGFYAKITDYNIGAMNTTDEGIYAGAYDNKNNFCCQLCPFSNTIKQCIIILS